ncbi:hypothetical protein GCM10011409_39240 [Lentibacillus populi]|uniref:Crp/Fnr family transcriptional regulator n=1 Tax=Lentibacillus populi TaxID=1827502 RepID=A0A9W5U235_9BACI|nr:Crp/Fnr family transcriptional regulator [Lentibacillus populi]GGB57905.1 hypothetical protein GCM10011409_39240 [Lentibacillus populi]
MENLLNTLSPWLDNLDYDWKPIIEKSTIKHFPFNAHIYYQGEYAGTVYIILSGRVRLYMTSHDGREKATFIAGKNCLIGENCVNLDKTYLKNAITASNVKVARISFSEFEAILYSQSKLMRQYIDLLNLKLRLANMYHLQLTYGNSTARICDALYHLASTYGEEQDNGITISIHFTHQELANLIGTSRVTVANTINDMIRQKVIVKKNKYYHIPELNKLFEYR